MRRAHGVQRVPRHQRHDHGELIDRGHQQAAGLVHRDARPVEAAEMAGEMDRAAERGRREDSLIAQRRDPRFARGAAGRGQAERASRGERLRNEAIGRRRERLRRRRLFSGHVGAGHGQLAHRHQRVSVSPVENEQVPHLGGDRERGHRLPVAREGEDHRLRGHVVVPEIVVDHLEGPRRAVRSRRGARPPSWHRGSVRAGRRRRSRATGFPRARRRGRRSGSADITLQALAAPVRAPYARAACRRVAAGWGPSSSAAPRSARRRRGRHRSARRRGCCPRWTSRRSPGSHDSGRGGDLVLAGEGRRLSRSRARSTVPPVPKSAHGFPVAASSAISRASTVPT